MNVIQSSIKNKVHVFKKWTKCLKRLLYNSLGDSDEKYIIK
jgi:hypothetical protein